MLRAVDIAVLLKLTLPGAAEATFLQLASELKLSPSEVHGSFQRAKLCGLLLPGRAKRVNRSALLELLEHGLRYVFPAIRGELTRGIPTSYAAEPLRGALHLIGEEIPVWPHVEGKVRGYSFEPLYKHAASAALKDASFYALLSLTDALRDGRVRERRIALEQLKERVGRHE